MGMTERQYLRTVRKTNHYKFDASPEPSFSPGAKQCFQPKNGSWMRPSVP
jgi:hypothetical protein